MSETPAENTTTPPAAVPTAPAAPQSVTAPAVPKPPTERTFTQAEVSAMMAEAKRTEKANAEKTLEERLAEIEKANADAIARAEQTAVNAIVAKAAAQSHNPALVAKAVDLTGLTSADAAAIEAKVAEFLTANPYLVNTGAPAAPVPAGVPGAGAGNGAGQVSAPGTMSQAEMDAVTPEQLANDEDLMKRYLASAAALSA